MAATAGCEQVDVADRDDRRHEHLPADGLFVMIGAQPRTDWLPGRGGTGPVGVRAHRRRRGADGRWTAGAARRSPTRPPCPGCSRSVTCAPGRSSGSRRRSARGRSSCRRCTSPPLARPRRGGGRKRRPTPWLPARQASRRPAARCIEPPAALLGLASCGSPTARHAVAAHPTHFWLVLGAALLSALHAYGTGAAAMRRRRRARHATSRSRSCPPPASSACTPWRRPHVLLDTPNAGFNVATPVGIAIGSVFAAASVREVDVGRAAARCGGALEVVRRSPCSCHDGLGRSSRCSSSRRCRPAPRPGAAVRPPWPRRGAPPILLRVGAVTVRAASGGGAAVADAAAMASAFVLLAEAMVADHRRPELGAVAGGSGTCCMLAAFVLVALGAQLQWREERFADLYLDDTVSGDREMSILFADLQGFTTFSERHDAEEVTAMLNTYFQVAIPPVVQATRRRDRPDHRRRPHGHVQPARRPAGPRRPGRERRAGPAGGHRRRWRRSTPAGRGSGSGSTAAPVAGQPARQRRRTYPHRHRRHRQRGVADRGPGAGRAAWRSGRRPARCCPELSRVRSAPSSSREGRSRFEGFRLVSPTGRLSRRPGRRTARRTG